jgi:hypothetical protein
MHGQAKWSTAPKKIRLKLRFAVEYEKSPKLFSKIAWNDPTGAGCGPDRTGLCSDDIWS